MQFPIHIISRSKKDTSQLAVELAKVVTSGTVITLQGELGVGKTTFIQALGQKLGITQPMPSPTYTLIKEYILNETMNFYHIDLYRLSHREEVTLLGLSDLFKLDKHIFAIEWPQLIDVSFLSKRFYVHFEAVDDHTRNIVVNKT